MKKGVKLDYALIFYWCLILSCNLGVAQRNTTVTVKVGVVLDVSGTIGKIGLSCINMALSDFYLSHSHYNTRLIFDIRDSHRDVVSAAAQAADLIKTEVEAIIGPTTSMEANFVISLGANTHVPIITFSATSPSLASLRSPYFFQFAQSDSTQVDAISAVVQAFGWKAVVPIYVDDNYGEGVIPVLTNALQQVDARLPYLSAISPSATNEDIREELYKLMTMQTRVFVVHVSVDLGSTLFTIAQQIRMMSQGYVWIITEGMATVLTSLNSSVIESMHGVLGVRTYVPKTKELDNFKIRLKRKFVQDNPTLVDTSLNVFGLWAYDATTALAMAVEKVGTTNPVFLESNASSNLTDLEKLPVSLNGDHLREALSNTKFRGFSGEFNVVDGQLQASALEIINVIGNGERRIGFWTSQKGLVKNLNSKNTSIYDTSKNNLAPIIWPGDSYSIPKGWDIPTNGKKMRIGVPVRIDYTEFVKITRDPSTKTTEVTGFCIDVFKAVVKVLPYALPYEFIPFAKPNGESAGTYNELISQVYYGNFDAVVGDVTILANRSNYVDFTLPYTESGLTMIVPLKYDRKQNAWDFLKPLTWELWVTAACSFIFIGFVVWVLEHRINENFRGPPSYQIGTSLWFSFSTMVSAHREKVVSNLGRFVVIIWIFLALILVQSYTTSLTSILTVEHLRPTITDVHQLVINRLKVGCKKGSFEKEILKDMGAQDYQFRFYNSGEGCNELLTKGSAHGGIDAAFDEIPYVKLYLGTYCSKYAMVDPQFKTGGFGFVFPKGSPLVGDISRAILNVTQGDKIKTIEKPWLKNSSCTESGASVSSNSLGLESFWGLFLIAGVASVLALTIFATIFLYQYRHIWLCYDPNTSIWKRIETLLRIFDERDERCHTFKESGVRDKTKTCNSHGLGAIEASLKTECPSSPCTQTDSNFSCNGEQAMFSADRGDANPNGDAPQDTAINMVGNIQSACRSSSSAPDVGPARDS